MANNLFGESLRANMLIGKLPSRYVALSDANIELLNQDWLFQTLKIGIDITFSLTFLSLLNLGARNFFND
jgi:hypothetical protein